MLKNIKIIWFDFDWTLVGDNINPKTNLKELFLFLKEKKILISIVTGKWLYFIQNFLKKYDLEVDFIISFDWACIFDYKTNKNIFREYILKSNLKKLLDICEKSNIKKVFFNKENWYEYLNESIKETSSLFKYMKKFDWNLENIYQFYIRDINWNQKQVLENLNLKLDLYFFNFNWQKDKYSSLITNLWVSKYNSFLYLLQKLKIQENEVLYFWDSINDLYFFKNQKIFSVSVSLSEEVIKNNANLKMIDNDFIWITKKLWNNSEK